jgi:F-type H+-transporting ATPase subunit a
MYIFSSPLEQFGITKIIPLFIGNFDFSFTNSSLLCVISCFIAFSFYNLSVTKAKLVPAAWQSLAEFLYEFVYFNLLSENVKKNGSFYFPMLVSVFSFIFFCNLMGMIPYSFTVTSHIAVTLGISMMTFFALNVVLVKQHGFHGFSFFLPAGAPLALAPLLVPIELVSYSFRVISLALRLFANMMSGHCLLKILAGFAWTMLSAGGALTIMHVLPLIVIFAIVGLELAIAFLQAYVFTVLLCIYLNDAISLH